jgi:hypothetical protein
MIQLIAILVLISSISTNTISSVPPNPIKALLNKKVIENHLDPFISISSNTFSSLPPNPIKTMLNQKVIESNLVPFISSDNFNKKYVFTREVLGELITTFKIFMEISNKELDQTSKIFWDTYKLINNQIEEMKSTRTYIHGLLQKYEKIDLQNTIVK